MWSACRCWDGCPYASPLIHPPLLRCWQMSVFFFSSEIYFYYVHVFLKCLLYSVGSHSCFVTYLVTNQWQSTIVYSGKCCFWLNNKRKFVILLHMFAFSSFFIFHSRKKQDRLKHVKTWDTVVWHTFNQFNVICLALDHTQTSRSAWKKKNPALTSVVKNSFMKCGITKSCFLQSSLLHVINT